MLSEENRQLCRLFAGVMDYPKETLGEAAGQCVLALERSLPPAAGPMGRFAAFVSRESRGKLEELYTSLFDVTPATTPYLGYHIFGEGPKRSTLLVRLQEAYRTHGFSAGAEMPDHLCVILRFLSVARDTEFVLPLLRECVLPALEKIERSLPDKDDGYAPAVKSLRLFLQQVQRSLVKSGGMAHG